MSEQPHTAQGAWNQGALAFADRKPLVTNNPYDQDRQHTMWVQWRRGWLNAQRESREQSRPTPTGPKR